VASGSQADLLLPLHLYLLLCPTDSVFFGSSSTTRVAKNVLGILVHLGAEWALLRLAALSDPMSIPASAI
jgi:hypothetical protein